MTYAGVTNWDEIATDDDKTADTAGGIFFRGLAESVSNVDPSKTPDKVSKAASIFEQGGSLRDALDIQAQIQTGGSGSGGSGSAGSPGGGSSGGSSSSIQQFPGGLMGLLAVAAVGLVVVARGG